MAIFGIYVKFPGTHLYFVGFQDHHHFFGTASFSLLDDQLYKGPAKHSSGEAVQ